MSDRTPRVHPSSFRDPSGFVFTSGSIVYRQVNQVYREHYDQFINGGLYQALASKNMIVPHVEVNIDSPDNTNAYKIIKPQQVPFLSWPYEWPFSMLKDAALLTLKIALNALEHDMVLKDATPYNIQWDGKKLVFIDTLSFEIYQPGSPWIAYRQFCENFLAPLLLMHYRKLPLHEWQLAYPEGIPLAVASKMLPRKSRFSMLCYLHIHLHAKIASRPKQEKERTAELSKPKLTRLLKSLEMLVGSLRKPEVSTTWGAYYKEASLRDDYLVQKEKIITSWLANLESLKSGIDLGANDGHFTELVSRQGVSMIATDADPVAINNLYEEVKSGKKESCLPLIINLARPSPAIGLNNLERTAFTDRAADRDIGLCLALIHHLRITHHIPFHEMAKLFHKMCRKLIIEFVPMDDPKVQEMLTGGRKLAVPFDSNSFEKGFAAFFKVLDRQPVPGTKRILYLMEKAKQQ